LTKEQRKAWEDLTGKQLPMPEIVVRKMLNQHAVGALPFAAPPPGGVPGTVFLPLAAPPPGAVPPPLPKR